MLQFKTSNGDIVEGAELTAALEKVAVDWRANAYAVRKEDDYAGHVTEADKNHYLEQDLAHADQIEEGLLLHNFTIWQRVNTVLTGDCVAFLPK